MVDKLKEGVFIPNWMLGGLITIVLTLFSWGVITASNNAEMKAQITSNKETIIKLEDSTAKLEDVKADQKDLIDIKATLVRIENKIDRHMAIGK